MDHSAELSIVRLLEWTIQADFSHFSRTNGNSAGRCRNVFYTCRLLFYKSKGRLLGRCFNLDPQVQRSPNQLSDKRCRVHRFQLSEGKCKVEALLDVFDIFNSAATLSATTVTGPKFGFPDTDAPANDLAAGCPLDVLMRDFSAMGVQARVF